MLYVPPSGTGLIEDNVADTAAEYGVTVTAHASIHTKNTTYATLLAATTRDSYGITVLIANVGLTASTNERMLVDIAVGAASSETVIIPNLICGNTPAMGGAMGYAALYYFPIFIAAGVRLSATCQALISADTCECAIWLHQAMSGPGCWVGSRVTAYGANTATSSGVAHTPGNASYATDTEIVASATNPIRYLQMGQDLGVDTTAATRRCLSRIGVGATPNYLAIDLPMSESTTLENVHFSYANMILSRMLFNIPAATRLTIGAMQNGAGEARNFVLYGVD